MDESEGWANFDEQYPPDNVWLHVRGQFGLKRTNPFEDVAKWYRSPTHEHGEFMTWEFQNGNKYGSHYCFVNEWKQQEGDSDPQSHLIYTPVTRRTCGIGETLIVPRSDYRAEDEREKAAAWQCDERKGGMGG